MSDRAAQDALALWQKLRQHFVDAIKVLEEIIETQAWEPLGYASFAEAWHAQMKDVTMAVEIRAHVVYQMLTEGYDYDQIASAVKGVGRDRVTSLDRQRRNGVPAKDATMTVVREHRRKNPTPPATLHLPVGPIALKRFQRIAEKVGKPVEVIAMEAVKARFKELDDVQHLI